LTALGMFPLLLRFENQSIKEDKLLGVIDDVE
jgi:hypothetical protein